MKALALVLLGVAMLADAEILDPSVEHSLRAKLHVVKLTP